MLKVPICYDNGGKTFDRYTLICSGLTTPKIGGWPYFRTIESGNDPRGFWQHGEISLAYVVDFFGRISFGHLVKRIKFADLPDAVKALYEWEYKCTHRPANVLGAWETSGGYAIAYNPVKTGPLVRYSVMWIPDGVSCDAPMVDTFIGKRASIKGQRVAWWALPPYIHQTFFRNDTSN